MKKYNVCSLICMVMILISLPLYATRYRITSFDPEITSIRIGSKECKLWSEFDANDTIHWPSKPVQITAICIDGSCKFPKVVFSKQSFMEKQSARTLAKYLGLVGFDDTLSSSTAMDTLYLSKATPVYWDVIDTDDCQYYANVQGTKERIYLDVDLTQKQFILRPEQFAKYGKTFTVTIICYNRTKNEQYQRKLLIIKR